MATGASAYCLEHFQASDCESFGPPVDATVLVALVAPLSACTSVKQYTDQEQIDQATATLGVVDLRGPCCQEVGDAISTTNREVLVPAVAGDAGEGCIIVSLSAVSVHGA